MADLSLDEFIRKSNVKVRISNKQQGRGGGKPQQLMMIQKRNNVSKQQPPVKQFDARNRLGPKRYADARDTIIVKKKSGGGDARNKIVQKQVQRGIFDARSLLQRQAHKVRGKLKNVPGGNFNVNINAVQLAGPATLRRTLSNPSAQGRPHIRLTDSGLEVTRPAQNPQSAAGSGGGGGAGQIAGSSRRRSFEEILPTSVPIIQIRNDRYRQPAQQSQPLLSSRHPSHPDYGTSSYPSSSYSTHPGGYRDYDDPQYNEASIAMLEIPKISVPNVRLAEAPAARPATYAQDVRLTEAPVARPVTYAQTRVPPGAASLSQGAKLPVTKTVLQPVKPAQAGVKRRPVQEISGPLKLGKGGGPGIDLGDGDPSPNKKIKVAARGEDNMEGGAEVISPLQGFRVMVTNLFAGVTQDDIIELFGAVGPLKKAKLLKPGSAEVVYVSREDAVSAVQKYHSRELDGQPMYVKMTTPIAAVVKKAVGDNDPDITGEALRLYKKGSGASSMLPDAAVEIPTIHRALFKAGPPGSSKSVKFTVKI